jgi:hypothetical protein
LASHPGRNEPALYAQSGDVTYALASDSSTDGTLKRGSHIPPPAQFTSGNKMPNIEEDEAYGFEFVGVTKSAQLAGGYIQIDDM